MYNSRDWQRKGKNFEIFGAIVNWQETSQHTDLSVPHYTQPEGTNNLLSNNSE